MTTHRNTFRKDERLCNRKLIAELFDKSKNTFEYPFKIFFRLIDESDPFKSNHPAQILFTVPKRQFKKAVVRNAIKRTLKEGYRKNKHLLYDYLESKKLKVIVGMIFIAKEPLTALESEEKIIKSLQRLTQTIDKTYIESKL